MKISHNIVATFKRIGRSSYADPARDWLILITLSTIALAGVIVWDIWAFDTVAGGGVIGTAVSQAPTVFDTSALDTVHTLFDSRAAEGSKYVTGTYHFVDPSQ